MSLDSPILGVVDLTHLDILESVKPIHNASVNQPIQEALKMSKKEVNKLTTGLIEILNEIKGIKSNTPSSLKDIMQDYNLDLSSDDDIDEYRHDVANAVDDLLVKLKHKHGDVMKTNTQKPVNNDCGFISFMDQLNARLVSFIGIKEEVERLFIEVKYDVRELGVFVPVMAYVCWNAWQCDDLVEYRKLTEVVPVASKIGPAELLVFIQIAQVVYGQCRNNGQK